MTKAGLKRMLFNRQNGLCCYCLVAMRFDAPTHHHLHPELEHVVAKSKGGRNSITNYSLACRGCNGSKGKKDVREFIRIRNKTSGELILKRV